MAKIKIKQNQPKEVFEPFTLEVTLENVDDFREFFHRMNVDRGSLKETIEKPYQDFNKAGDLGSKVSVELHNYMVNLDKDYQTKLVWKESETTKQKWHNVYQNPRLYNLTFGQLGSGHYVLDNDGNAITGGYHSFTIDALGDMYGHRGARMKTFVLNIFESGLVKRFY